MDDRLVTIVLTTLNAARYLRQSVDSCLGQTYSNIELIVVDGGSTDGTLEILAEYWDPRMRLILQRGNIGKLPGAINLGIDQARGNNLTWMQADSTYHPQAIAKMVEGLVNHPNVGHVYADYWVIDSRGAILKVVQTCEPEEILNAKDDPCGVCFMIRKTTRELVGPHDVDAYPTQDYDYRLRIAMKTQSLHINEPLYYWRLHPDSLTGSRPWTIDAKNDVRIRMKLGLSRPKQARLEIAEIDMAWAFECYQTKEYGEVAKYVWLSLRRNPRYLLNRGVLAILGKSFSRLFKSQISV
jgi:glycosyltransferase involved in cell wall biosynthesis